MKILLTSIGTRGDVEPFLAVGEMLAARGHEVVYAFPQQFAALSSPKATFHALSPRFIELIESKEGRTVMGKAGVLAKVRAIGHLYKEGQRVSKALTKQHYAIIEQEAPDVIIHNAKCSYPPLWGLKYHKKTVLLSPVPYFMYYVKGNAHIGFHKNLGTFLNKLTYRLANFGLVKTIFDAQKQLPEKKTVSKSAIRKTLFEEKLIYTISPQLFARPDYWKKHVQVLGYHERNKIMDWQASDELIRFLEKHSKVVFLTFGSMVNSAPEASSRMLYRVLDDLQIATIVNTAAGGLLPLPEFEAKEHFFFTEQIPYDWILSRVHAVVHHGGSGTTHTALKYGKPTLIIPHIIDQFGWNRLIHTLGVGPKGVSVNKLNASRFRELLTDLLENETYQRKSAQIAANMASEQLEEELCRFILED